MEIAQQAVSMSTLALMAKYYLRDDYIYISLIPTRNEISAGLVDCDGSLGNKTHFGKTFATVQYFF
jgi:hypothetical protein